MFPNSCSKRHIDTLKNTDFKALARKQKSVQMKMQLLALAHFQEGHSRPQIAKFLKVSRTSVNKWIKAYLNNGMDGLQEKPRTGRPTLLTTDQQKQLVEYLEKNAVKPTGGRLTGADIHQYTLEEFNKNYHPDHVYTVLKRLGFSWISSRSRHPKQSQQVQDDFKKIQNRNDP